VACLLKDRRTGAKRKGEETPRPALTNRGRATLRVVVSCANEAVLRSRIDSAGERIENYVRATRPGSGFGGQLPIVIPAYDIVMVFTAWNILDGPGLRHREAIDRVLAAVTDGKR
jgi:hypothetical protein